MNTTTLKINWDFVSRLFLGLLFVVAGLGKMMNFTGTSMFIDSVMHTGVLTTLVTALTIAIEVIVAGLFIFGKYRKDCMAYILIAFTVLATIIFHNHISDQNTMIMALKNLAIVGGLISTLDCVHKKRV